MLVGIDFMTAYNITVRFGEIEIKVPSGQKASVSSVKIAATPVTSDQTCFAYTTKEVIVPPAVKWLFLLEYQVLLTIQLYL